MGTPVSAVGIGNYGDYTQKHHFETDTGVVPLPVSSRTPAVKLIRLHGGMGVRRIEWQASRAGQPPIVPSAVDITDGEFTSDKLVSHTLVSQLGQPNPQTGGYNYAVSGEYLYIQMTPRVPGTNTIPSGGSPYPISIIDSQAGSMLGGAGLNPVPNPDNPYDGMWGDLGDSNVNHDTGDFSWPFTALPRIFFTDAAFNL